MLSATLIIRHKPIAKKKKKQKKTTEPEDLSEDLCLEEEVATMLKTEYGEDTEILKIIDEMEKQSKEDSKQTRDQDEDEDSDFRRCPNCGLDTLFIDKMCSECEYCLKSKKKKDEDDTDEYDYNQEDD